MARTVLVTGGTGNLGGAVIAAFERDGWTVVEASQPSGYDLTSADDARRAVDACGDDLQAVACLVGGFKADMPVAETPVDEVRALWELNVVTAYQVAHAAIPRLPEDGAMVLVSARSGMQPFAGGSGYAMAKAAVLALARTIDTEGVRCNAVVPVVIEDPPRVADAIAWLCSPASRAVRGAAVPV